MYISVCVPSPAMSVVPLGGGGVCLPGLGLHSVLAGASLPAHDNTTRGYYVQVGSWWLGSGMASGWVGLPFGGALHLFCC